MSGNKTLSPTSAEVMLSQRDLDALVRVADLYMTIKPLRPIVRFAAPRDIRARFRFVADESRWLKRFAREMRTGMRSDGLKEREVTFTLPALVGFWGRLLASVNSPRTRRRLSKTEFEIRQELIARFQEALTALASRNRRQVEEQIQTRRPVEEVWMRDRLGLPQRHQ
jgi:hypothetical protein